MGRVVPGLLVVFSSTLGVWVVRRMTGRVSSPGSSDGAVIISGVDGVSVDTPIYVLIVVPLSNSSAMMPPSTECLWILK